MISVALDNPAPRRGRREAFSAAAILLSVRESHARRIFRRQKTVELRRLRPPVAAGAEVVIYVPSPVRKIVGSFRARGILCGPPSGLWKRVGRRTGLSRREYDAYFAGSATAFGIRVSQPRLLERPLTLRELRTVVPGFHPPRSYYRVDSGSPRPADGWYELYHAALAAQGTERGRPGARSGPVRRRTNERQDAAHRVSILEPGRSGEAE